MSEATLSCTIDPARATALAAALGEPRSFAAGDALPPLWHLIYFWDAQPPAALGRDGHPATGGLIPDTGLPRRMWAAGKTVFHQPFRAGIAAQRITRLEGVTRKDGRSGPLAFVRLRHDIRQRQSLVITDYQDLVYRADPAPGVAPAEPPRSEFLAVLKQPFVGDPTLLFRFSALTFNGHRIHYDADYAREVEGYDGLVVHGPLIALALAGLAERAQGELQSFEFRAKSPLVQGVEAELCWAEGALCARTPGGRLIMDARAG